MFLNGDVDICAVPRQYIDSDNRPAGIRCIYPLAQPFLSTRSSTSSTSTPRLLTVRFCPREFSETGVPERLLWKRLMGSAREKGLRTRNRLRAYLIHPGWPVLGEAMQPPTAMIPTLPYYYAIGLRLHFDLNKAAEELRQRAGYGTQASPYSSCTTLATSLTVRSPTNKSPQQ